MNPTRKSLALLAIMVALGLAGCPALMLPSLAYQGYKSTQKSDESGTGSQDPADQNKKPTDTQGQSAPDSSIE